MIVIVLLQAGMELRVLHAAAHKTTWYGQWGYQYGRGAFNITHSKYVSTQAASFCFEPQIMTVFGAMYVSHIMLTEFVVTCGHSCCVLGSFCAISEQALFCLDSLCNMLLSPNRCCHQFFWPVKSASTYITCCWEHCPQTCQSGSAAFASITSHS